MFRMFRRYANNLDSKSLSTKFRRKRFILFKSLINSVPRPIKILDVGGTQAFWEKMDFCGQNHVEITILNVTKIKINYTNFISITGDARDLKQFGEKEFDVVFSNSVIEHVGTYNDQRCMANEVIRVGKRFFLQTPNRYFPIEPHFLFPFFQFFPLWLKVWLVTHFDIGWFDKIIEKREAIETCNSLRLLSKQELKDLFPGSSIFREKIFGLTKSFTIYNGWSN